MTDMRATERLLVGKRYDRRIRMIDQHMYCAWRIGVDGYVLRKMLATATASLNMLTELTRSIGEHAVKMNKAMQPLLAEARREQSVRDAVARREEFEV